MRKKLFKWHSYSALIAMLPILVVSITGSLLVFKVEIDGLLRPHHMLTSANQASSRLNLDELMNTVTSAHPNYVIASWELFDNKIRSDTAYLIQKGTENWVKVYVDQYTGALLSSPQGLEHYISDWLLELHYAFLLHFNGTVIGILIGLIMLFLGISGIILHKRFWAKLFALRWHAAKRIMFSDIHKMLGIWASPVFIVIAFTGVYWNASIVLHEVLEHSSDEQQHVYITESQYDPSILFELLRVETAEHIQSFQPTYMVVPYEPSMQITFYGDVKTANILLSEYASTVTYDKLTGEVLTANDIRDASIWEKLDDSTRKLHFGYFAGLGSKIVWCVIGLFPLWLGLTGLTMYILRRKQQRSKRNRI